MLNIVNKETTYNKPSHSGLSCIGYQQPVRDATNVESNYKVIYNDTDSLVHDIRHAYVAHRDSGIMRSSLIANMSYTI